MIGEYDEPTITVVPKVTNIKHNNGTITVEMEVNTHGPSS